MNLFTKRCLAVAQKQVYGTRSKKGLLISFSNYNITRGSLKYQCIYTNINICDEASDCIWIFTV